VNYADAPGHVPLQRIYLWIRVRHVIIRNRHLGNGDFVIGGSMKFFGREKEKGEVEFKGLSLTDM